MRGVGVSGLLRQRRGGGRGLRGAAGAGAGATRREEFQLVEVGRLEDPSEETYRDGQIFVHRRLSYRGIVLFSFQARVTEAGETMPLPTTSKAFYAALIHQPDMRHLRMPFHETFHYLRSEAQTDLRSQSMSKLDGVDLASHDDLLPLASSIPIAHPLFPSLFSVRADPALEGFVGTSELDAARRRFRPILSTAQVKSQRSGDVSVQALFVFLGKAAQASVPTFLWRYTIRFENSGQTTLTLRTRDFKLLTLGPNKLERLPERSPVGYEPTLSANAPIWQYSSLLSTTSATAHLFGRYVFEDEEQSQVTAQMPSFILNAPVQNEFNA